MKRTLVFIAAVGIASLAHAQATRTWVSGTGDDVNPCSRTAPCKTFAGAISKTASPGIINCLDPGGYGTVTITKSIKIDCTGTMGSVLASGTQGIVVNALTTDDIVLQAIDIDGSGTTLGTNGVNVIQARSVSIMDCNVAKFSTAGVHATNSSNSISLVLSRDQILNTAIGVFIQNSGGSVSTTMFDSIVAGSSNMGVDIAGPSDNTLLNRSVVTKSVNAGFQVDQGSSGGMLESSTFSFNGTGVVAGTSGATPTIRLARTNIFGNTVAGISGTGTTGCFSSNVVAGNNGNNNCSAPNQAQQ